MAMGMGFCEARNKRGDPCGSMMVRKAKSSGRWLCRFHAGWSTGPRTPEGKAIVAMNLRRTRR
jgi:hypothetical protein